jgi:predicted transcriptional regulator
MKDSEKQIRRMRRQAKMVSVKEINGRGIPYGKALKLVKQIEEMPFANSIRRMTKQGLIERIG